MRHSCLVTATALLLAALLTSCATTTTKKADEGKRAPHIDLCYRAPGPITIDGVMEDAWKKAPLITHFTVPPKGQKPYMKTEARILWDDEALYVFMKAYDKDITAYRTERDSDTCNDDVLELFLVPDDPATAVSYLNFEINALGTVHDAYVYNRNLIAGRRWQFWNAAKLEHAVKIHGTLNNFRDEDEAWCLELKLPFSDMPWMENRPLPINGEQWAFHLARYDWSIYQPNGCELSSSAKLTKANFHFVPDFDIIQFVR